jgi:hypothetical protein
MTLASTPRRPSEVRGFRFEAVDVGPGLAQCPKHARHYPAVQPAAVQGAIPTTDSGTPAHRVDGIEIFPSVRNPAACKLERYRGVYGASLQYPESGRFSVCAESPANIILAQYLIGIRGFRFSHGYFISSKHLMTLLKLFADSSRSSLWEPLPGNFYRQVEQFMGHSNPAFLGRTVSGIYMATNSAVNCFLSY